MAGGGVIRLARRFSPPRRPPLSFGNHYPAGLIQGSAVEPIRLDVVDRLKGIAVSLLLAQVKSHSRRKSRFLTLNAFRRLPGNSARDRMNCGL
jgi:hypothetical protein